MAPLPFIRRPVALFVALGALLLAPAAVAEDYQVYKDANCGQNAECGINFAKVPAGQTLTIENLSCYLRYANDSSVGAMQLVLVNSDGSRDFAVTPNLHFQDSPKPGENASLQIVHVSNDTMRVVAKPDQFFRAYAQVYRSSNGSLGTVLQLSCGISGELK